MTSLVESWTRPVDSRSLTIALGAILTAALVGIVLAIQLPLGVALLLGLSYGLICLYAPVWSMVAFVPLVFLEAVPALNAGGKAAGLLVTAAWIGAVVSGRLDVGPLIRRHRRLFECLVALLVWLLLSAVWADDPGAVLGDIWRWVAVALLFTVVATWAADRQVLIWVCVALVVGAVLSVMVGMATGMQETASAGVADPRLSGGVGDPNFLAAGLIPGMVLAAGLMVVFKNALARLSLFFAIAICGYGIAASQSRGGFLALIFVFVAALLVFRRRRIYVTVACLGLVALGAVYFTITPAAWERISNIDNGGSGRNGLWTVAWQVSEDNPVAGVGLNNYQSVAKDYARESGPLADVRKIAEQPNVVHNTYLQALAETGIVGLVLLIGIGGGSCYAGWRAGRRFEAIGDTQMEALAQATLVATIGMAAAVFFVSAGVDKRLWILFALGPATLAIASRAEERYRTP